MKSFLQICALFFCGFLELNCVVVAQQSSISKEYIQNLVEVCRSKAFTSILQEEGGKKVEVFRMKDAAGNMLERRDYYSDDICENYFVQKVQFI